MRDQEAAVVASVVRFLRPEIMSKANNLKILVWERSGQSIGGFVIFGSAPVSASAHGIDMKCIEAIWVASYLRGTGVEEALAGAAGEW